MSDGGGIRLNLKNLSLGSVIALMGGLGGAWVFGERVSNYLDDRVVGICTEQDATLREEIGNMRGQLGEVWMELCELTPNKRWYRGDCIDEDGQ